MTETEDKSNESTSLSSNITVKQEKISPGRELNAEVDSKSTLVLNPVGKSSDEILAELFGVLKAPPPTIGSDGKHKKSKKKKSKKSKVKKEKKSGDEEENESSGSSDDFEISGEETGSENGKKKKKKKKHKHKKVKVKKEKQSDASSDDSENPFDMSDDGSLDSKGEKKRKKHKKHKKHKVKKERKSDEDEEGEIRASTERKLSKERTRTRSRSRNKSRDPDRHRDPFEKKEKPKIMIKSLANSTVIRDALKAAEEKQKRRRSRSRSRDRKRRNRKSDSDFSFSDEESSRSRHASSNHSSSSRYRNPYARPIKPEPSDSRGRANKFYDGYYESYRHSRDDRWRGRSRDRGRRGRSRSRSGDRLDIDKKKLLEIARKNAIQMLKNGTLPGAQNLSEETKDKLMQKVRFGGKSVAELTEYCKKLSNGEMELDDISEPDSDMEPAFHHPFELKERGPIVMNIANAKPIPPKSAEQKKELLKLFPVSSGQEHRVTEAEALEWVPVEPTPAPAPVPVPEPATTKASIPATTAAPIVPLTAPAPSVPPTMLPPAPPPPSGMPPSGVPPPPPTEAPGTSGFDANAQLNLELANSWKESNFGFGGTQAKVIDTSNPTVFQQQINQGPVDVNKIIASRLDAMRRLQENPNDWEATKILDEAQKKMSAWASSKYTPGQFLGSTGVNVLSAKELAGTGNKAWAKKDTLTSTKPVDSGMGMHLLQKMGWRPGEGLGKDKSGTLQPLLLDVKHDRRGLVSVTENPRMKVRRPLRMSLDGKHPVSLLGELSSKRKWGAPNYEVAMEQGPGHAKLFVYKVRVNGMEYQPAIASNTKKEAKAVAAKFCLQQLGILPT